jgi:glycosyltransferase involved in cell wall biosynthesis
MAVLEAMAGGCAVVATTEPSSNEHLLAEGRGIAITPAGRPDLVRDALFALLKDLPRRHRMGQLAQEYVHAHHSAEALRRSLLRATGWAPDLAAMARAHDELQPIGDVKGNV